MTKRKMVISLIVGVFAFNAFATVIDPIAPLIAKIATVPVLIGVLFVARMLWTPAKRI